MGTLRIASGQKWNAFERGTITVSSEHSQLLKKYLADGRTNRPYRAAAAAVTDLLITLDANFYANTPLSTWSGGVPANHSKTGTVVETTVAEEVRGGSAAKISPAGRLFLTNDLLFKTGRSYQVDAWARVDSTGGQAELEVYNPVTNKYLTTGGAWSATQQSCTSMTSTTYAQQQRSFAVEGFGACGFRDTVPLRITMLNASGSGFAFFDDVTVYPGINCASLHGIRLEAAIAVQVRDSDDNFAGADNLRTTMTQPLRSPSDYVLFAIAYRRYWRFKFVGTTVEAFEATEAVLTEVIQPTQHYETPRVGESRFDQLAATTPGGERHIHKRSKFMVRRRTFRYSFAGVGAQAAHDNARELFFDRPEGESWPALVITDTDLPEVMYARLLSSWAQTNLQADYITDVVVDVDEMPFASSAS